MKQQALVMAADQGVGFETHRKRTRRDEFLDTMNVITPWAELCAVVEPHCPKRGNGRPPIGLERMLCIHFIQHWFNLADFAGEEALYASASLHRIVGIELAAKLCRTRRRCSKHVFAVVKRWGFTKVRYRGLGKNANRAFVALANAYLSHRRLMEAVRP